MYAKTIIASILGLSAFAAAQSSTTTQVSTSTGVATVLVHAIRVGNADGDLVFEPEVLRANVGDFVQFQFYPRNHSIAQSSFDKPCVPLEGDDAGFFSGFMPVEASNPVQPVFTIPVKDDKPIWFYCATGRHCQGGMSGVINPPNNTERTLDAYKSGASSVAQTKYPGQPAGGDDSQSDDEPTGTDDDATSPSESPESGSGAGSIRASLAGLLIAAGFTAMLF